MTQPTSQIKPAAAAITTRIGNGNFFFMPQISFGLWVD
jgi:hypothetical protein